MSKTDFRLRRCIATIGDDFRRQCVDVQGLVAMGSDLIIELNISIFKSDPTIRADNGFNNIYSTRISRHFIPVTPEKELIRAMLPASLPE